MGRDVAIALATDCLPLLGELVRARLESIGLTS